MQVLVDTSVWVDYFRSGINSSTLDLLIDENLIATNDIILAELIPFLKIKGQRSVINLLTLLHKLPLTIEWDGIIQYQVKCLRAGANGIGIPDLIIAQNANNNGCCVFSLDKHFKLLKRVIKVELFEG